MPRPYPIITPLGRRMRYLNLPAYKVSTKAGFTPRVLTEYLAGRAKIPNEHLANLARVLDVDPEDIQTPDHILAQVAAKRDAEAHATEASEVVP